MEPLCSVLSQAARFSASEMFTVELRKVMPIVFDYVRFMSHIIEPMSKSKLVKDDIQNAGIFEFLFEMALKCEEPENAKNLDFRVAALSILLITRPPDETLGILSIQVRSGCYNGQCCDQSDEEERTTARCQPQN